MAWQDLRPSHPAVRSDILESMIDPALASLTSMTAQFTHPVFRGVAQELESFEEAVTRLTPRMDLMSPSRLKLTSREPLGVVTVLALPSARLEAYSRHIAAALLVGNSVLLAPLNRSQHLVAERMDRALRERVWLAGETPTLPIVECGTVLVTLGEGWFRIESGEEKEDSASTEARYWLCGRYSRLVTEVAAVRTTFLFEPRGGPMRVGPTASRAGEPFRDTGATFSQSTVITREPETVPARRSLTASPARING